MGFRLGSVSSTTIQNAALPASDTIVLLSPPLNIPLDNVQVQLWWFLQMATGVGGTVIVWKVSRGSVVSGSPLFSGSLTTVASTNVFIVGCQVDTPGAVGGVQYNLSINDNGGGGTAQFGCILAACL